MNLFGLLDVSGSALKAQRVRAEVVAANMANSETTRTVDGGPYRRHHVVFEAQDGSGFAGALSGAASALEPAGSQALQASQVGQVRVGSHVPALLPLVQFGGLNGFGGSSGPAGGVAVSGVIEDQSAPLARYDPGHPDADANGFVQYPDINPLTEMVDLIGATRAYGMNTSAVQAEKGMLTASLELLK